MPFDGSRFKDFFDKIIQNWMSSNVNNLLLKIKFFKNFLKLVYLVSFSYLSFKIYFDKSDN